MPNYKAPVLENFQWQQPVLDKDLTSPPAASKGDRYIVAAGASGAWAGQAGKIALYTGVGWEFIAPSTGMRTFVIDEILDYYYNAAWIAEYFLTSAERTKLNNLSGTNTGDVTLAANHGLSLTGQVLAMGTPSTVTPDTANGVTTTTHTHALTGVVRNNGTVNPSNLVDNGDCENWTPATADAYTSLLLHMDDTGLTDSSTFAHTITLNGGAARSAVWSKFGGYSCLLDGTTGYLDLGYTSTYAFGSGDFTIDMVRRFTNLTTFPQVLFSMKHVATTNAYMNFTVVSATVIRIRITTDGSTNMAYYDFTVPTLLVDTDYHIELVRSGSNVYLFLNGTSITNVNVIQAIGSSAVPAFDTALLGVIAGAGFSYGYFDEVRVSKGIARHTTNFTPDTSPYSYSLNNWTLFGTGASQNREVTNIRSGLYSVKLTRAGTNCYLYNTDRAALNGKPMSYWRGKTITVAGLVNAAAGSTGVFIRIQDGITNAYSNAHSTSVGYELLVLTYTIDAAATNVSVELLVSGTDQSAYFDSIMVVEGASAFAFAPKPLFVGSNPSTEMVTLGGGLTIAQNLVIGTAGRGIDFSADANAAGMTSELLDDYEEGTWTPTITFGGGSTGLTYVSRAGYYTRVGNLVTLTALITFSNKGSSTGPALLSGLPFSSVNNDASYVSVSMWLWNISYANQHQHFITPNTSAINMYEITEAGVISVLDDTNFSNASGIVINVTYRAQ